MAKTNKITDAELERDEVADTLQNLGKKLYRNRTKLILLVFAVIIVAVVYGAYNSHRERVMRDSNQLLLSSLSRYNQLLNSTDERERSDARDTIVQQTDQVRDEIPGTPLAHYALYVKGVAQYSTDQSTQSQATFEQCLKEAANDQERARAEIALGYAYENQSFLLTDKQQQLKLVGEALSHYENAAKVAPDSTYLHYYALLGQARLAELTAKNDKAVELLKKIIDERKPLREVDKNEDTKPLSDDPALQATIDQINGYEDSIGFAATAKLRLGRLQARMSQTTPATGTTPVARPAAGAVAATPVVATPRATATPAVATPLATATPATRQP